MKQPSMHSVTFTELVVPELKKKTSAVRLFRKPFQSIGFSISLAIRDLIIYGKAEAEQLAALLNSYLPLFCKWNFLGNIEHIAIADGDRFTFHWLVGGRCSSRRGQEHRKIKDKVLHFNSLWENVHQNFALKITERHGIMMKLIMWHANNQNVSSFNPRVDESPNAEFKKDNLWIDINGAPIDTNRRSAVHGLYLTCEVSTAFIEQIPRIHL